MTTEIYVQTTPVNITGGVGRHLAIWIVKDGVTTVIDARASGFLGNTGLDPLVPLGEIVLEKHVVNSEPDDGTSDGFNEFEEFNLNQLTFSSQQEANDAADKLLTYFNNMGTSFVDDGREFVRTGVDYGLSGPNSDSIGNTLLNLIGTDFRNLNLYEDGNSSLEEYTPSDHPGHMTLIDGAGADNFKVYQYDGWNDTTTFIDQADSSGLDTLTIESGASVRIVGADGGAPVSDIDIVLTDITGGVTLEAYYGDLIIKVDDVQVAYIENGLELAVGDDLTLKYDDGSTVTTLKDLTSLDSSDFSNGGTDDMPTWHVSVVAFFGLVGNIWDPLVIDLDGDGLSADFISAQERYFDLDGDGFASATQWHMDGFLARDINANGLIDDGTELFGNGTTNGFDALAVLMHPRPNSRSLFPLHSCLRPAEITTAG